MKVYIAGPISNNSRYKEQFGQAEEILKKRGYTVINPAMLPKQLSREDALSICIAMLNVADAIALLPRWTTSAGARLEADYACQINKEIIRMDNLETGGIVDE